MDLRTVIVLTGVAIGAFYAIRSPFYALLLYLGLAYFRPEQWVWTDNIASLNLSLIAGIFLLCSALASGHRPKLNPRMALLGLFFLQTIVATGSSEHFDWSWMYWQDLAKVLIVSSLIPALVTDTARLRMTFLVIALSLGVEAAKQGWLGFVGGAEPNMNTHPLLGDNNGVAQAMMMLVPFLALLAQTARSPWERNLHRFLLVGAFLRGVLTYSRGGILAALALGFHQLLRSKYRLRALILVALLATAISITMPASFWERMNTISVSEENQDESARGRLHFWHVAVVMTMAKPWTGVGLNGFQRSYDDYDDSLGLFGRGRAVHSTWFGVAGELGLVGFGLFVAILASAGFACRRIRKLGRSNPALGDFVPYATALEASLVAFAVAGTFLNGQYFEMLWHVIGLTIALQCLAEKASLRVQETLPDAGAVSARFDPGARGAAVARWGGARIQGR